MYFCILNNLEMKLEIKLTNDGSKTIYIPEMDEHYHSSNGAFNEAMHVFIEHGLRTFALDKPIQIFEMGFGTGLNALLTLNETKKLNRFIEYIGIDAFPVDFSIIQQMDYSSFNGMESTVDFLRLHELSWNEKHQFSPFFSFQKIKCKIEDFEPENETIDLIYFDAFGPRAQKEMWHPTILKKMYDLLKPSGILVTYCAQGQFKRDLKALGFEVIPLPGPPGKREMTKAMKK